MRFSMRFSMAFAVMAGVGAVVAINSAAQQPQDQQQQAQTTRPANAFDDVIRRNSDRMLEDGRRIFRFDTFGDEAFWGDTLRLHEAIEGTRFGGVGAGVSPATALA